MIAVEAFDIDGPVRSNHCPHSELLFASRMDCLLSIGNVKSETNGTTAVMDDDEDNREICSR